MAIRKVARMGHPVLRQKARFLTVEEIRSEATGRLIDDMIDTMREYQGIGLAAPQIHESVQVAVIELDEASRRYPDMGLQPLSVFINPKITVLDPEEQAFWEGCLSIPEIRALVHRPREIQVDYLDREGKPQRVVVEDFLATVFQHELDHLQGVLFVDRIRPVPGETFISFVDEYVRYWLPAQRAQGEAEEALDE